MDTKKVGWDSHYHKIRKSIDFELYRNYDRKNPYVKRMLKFAKGKNCSLEFGSGKGGLSLILKKNYPEMDIHLLDLEKDAVEYSKGLFQHYGLNAQFHTQSFMNLPFPNDFFDFIHGNTVLEHVKETNKAVKELSRVLRKDGYILVTVPNSNRRFDGHDLYHTINRFDYFSRTFYPKELEKFFTDNSCEIVDQFGTGCIYHYPSYLPRYFMEKIRLRKQSSQSHTQNFKTNLSNSNTNNLSESIYSVKEKKLYKSTFLFLDKIWDPIQRRINLFTSRNETLPYSWYITIGIVAKKSI